jgi:glutamyl/glutaminyl-tRNA synthetase
MARTRFAPSPTGSLHVGGARTALYCLLWARRTGSPFLLRIEDTDQVRSTDEAARGIVRDLQWLGLLWDEGPEVGGPAGPYFQSQRLAIYDRYVDALLASGHAYEAWEDKSELEALRAAAEARKETFRYTRRPYAADEVAGWRAAGRAPVVRLAAPTHAVTVPDAVLGDVTVAADHLDDIVIRKADGFPTYHFAVVIDDHLMGVDLILRGQEHLMNTHKHEGIYEALGWRHPGVGHLPLIFNPAGAKMSKRDKAKVAREAAKARAKAEQHGDDWRWLAVSTGYSAAEIQAFADKKSDGVAIAEAIAKALGVALPLIEVQDYRKAGYVPEALLNYLLLLGWNPGNDREFYTVDEMVAEFDLSRINKTSARFDPAKVQWMNGEYLKRLPLDALLARHDQYLEVRPDSPLGALDRDRRASVLSLWRERCATFAEIDAAARFLFHRPLGYDPKAAAKHFADGGLDRLATAGAAFADVAWDARTLESALLPLTDGTPAGMGRFAQPLRVAITGTAVSPPIFDVLAWLGRDEVLARIAAAQASQTR